MNFIRISQNDGELIFENTKRSEILFVKSEDNMNEVYINIDSTDQTPNERQQMEDKYQVKLNEFINYAYPRLEFIKLEEKELNKLFTETIIIPKGWENECKMACIYVGWGVETFNNIIRIERIENTKVKLRWSGTSDDLDYYDENAIPCKFEIQATLDVLNFLSKEDYYEYERSKEIYYNMFLYHSKK